MMYKDHFPYFLLQVRAYFIEISLYIELFLFYLFHPVNFSAHWALKKDGSMWMFIDYRQLDVKAIATNFQIPQSEWIISQLKRV